jgi:RsiW-degrading membrane proteinase PrsW (M82 family)
MAFLVLLVLTVLMALTERLFETEQVRLAVVLALMGIFISILLLMLSTDPRLRVLGVALHL